MNFELKVNGRTVQVNVPAEMPLLWVLRDALDLPGTKFGCGAALCGACTVHLDGSAARSCSLPVSAAVGVEITTIEGLSPDGSHPLQQAWQELDVPQCGYCQAGQIMAAAALLERNPNPSDAELDAALSGNLCRCASYPRIRAAIHEAVAAVAGRSEVASPGSLSATAPATER